MLVWLPAWPSAWLPAWLPASLGCFYLLAAAVPLSLHDWRSHRLPNRLVLPGYPVAWFGQLIALVLTPAEWHRLPTATAAAIFTFAAGLLAHRFIGLGMGDVKLLALIALNLSWFDPLAGLVSLALGGLISASVAIAIIAWRRTRTARESSKPRSANIPVGPYLLAGFAVTLLDRLMLGMA